MLGAWTSFLVMMLAIPWLLLRPKTRPGLKARLGFPSVRASDWPDHPRVWVHAASAGDVKNIWPIIRMLKGTRPDVRIILSVVTRSGAEMAGKMDPPPDVTTFLPLDARPFVDLFLRRVSADLVLLECAELWPQLLRGLHHRRVPVVLCNGRLHDKNVTPYRVLFGLMGAPWAAFGKLCIQSDDDARRFHALGAPQERCVVAGNCKFDSSAQTPPQERINMLAGVLGTGHAWLVAGSTHAGEEELMLQALAQGRRVEPSLRLLWAPRYTEAVDACGQLAAAKGYRWARRSAGADACRQVDVVLLDTMGELAAAYALGRVAVVGGSFVPRGGQNILEPAAQGVPVLHGPQMFLSMDQTRALDGHGAEEVTADRLPSRVAELLRDGRTAAEMGRLGRQSVLALRGAAERHLACILPLLPDARPADSLRGDAPA